MGRSDDMMIIRGVNVFPSQIETVLLNEGYSPNYQIEVDRVNNTDTLDVYVELSPEQFTDSLEEITKQEKHLVSAIRTMLGILRRYIWLTRRPLQEAKARQSVSSTSGSCMTNS